VRHAAPLNNQDKIAVIPAKAGIQLYLCSLDQKKTTWIPAFAGMTACN
jgi:hypothetical protein